MQPLKPPKPSVPPPPSMPPASSHRPIAGALPRPSTPPGAPPLRPTSSVPPPNFRAPVPAKLPAHPPAPSFPVPAPAPAPGQVKAVEIQPDPLPVGPAVAAPAAVPAPAPAVAPEEIRQVEDNELLSDDEISALAEELEETESKVRRGALRNKGTIAVWLLAGCVGLAVVLQRTGALHSAAVSLGQESFYLEKERELFGGPGSHTVRDATELWKSELSASSFPFSKKKTNLASPTPTQPK